MMTNIYSIKDIFKVKDPYVMAYKGNSERCMQQIYDEYQKHEKAKVFFFKGKDAGTKKELLEIIINPLGFNSDRDRNYDELQDYIKRLDEHFVDGGDYIKFVFYFQDSELMFVNEKNQLKHLKKLIEIFNNSANFLSIPVAGTTDDRPAIPFHVIYHTTKKDFEFIKKLPQLKFD